MDPHEHGLYEPASRYILTVPQCLAVAGIDAWESRPPMRRSPGRAAVEVICCGWLQVFLRAVLSIHHGKIPVGDNGKCFLEFY